MSTNAGRIPDQLPNIDQRKGRCPHCGGASNFEMKEGALPVQFDPHGEVGMVQRVGVLHCPGCNKGTVVLEEALVAERQEILKAGGQIQQVDRELPNRVVTGWRGVLWWPVSGAGDLDPDIPEPVASAFLEGMRALSVNCPRAAAVMFRGMLTAVVRNKGSKAAQQKANLYQQLQAMEQEGRLYPSLVQWAAEIRLVGNAGAHFDELAPVDQTEAAALGRLCRQLLSVVYEIPARISRARATS